MRYHWWGGVGRFTKRFIYKAVQSYKEHGPGGGPLLLQAVALFARKKRETPFLVMV